jgi:hypothetical protein
VSVFCEVTGAHAINSFASVSFAHLDTFDHALLQHLRVAVPVYVVLFYFPNVVTWFLRRGRGRTRVEAGERQANDEGAAQRVAT